MNRSNKGDNYEKTAVFIDYWVCFFALTCGDNRIGNVLAVFDTDHKNIPEATRSGVEGFYQF
jgi:hypothetical protein